MQIYLLLNAIMWLGLGIWCALTPEKVAEKVGFQLFNNQGVVEFMAVYGGLELGVGVFYFAAWWFATLQFSAVLFSACVYGGIVLMRLAGILARGTDIGSAWYFFGVESLMFLSALYLLSRNYQGNVSPI